MTKRVALNEYKHKRRNTLRYSALQAVRYCAGSTGFRQVRTYSAASLAPRFLFPRSTFASTGAKNFPV
jgi:hypothetical protein